MPPLAMTSTRFRKSLRGSPPPLQVRERSAVEAVLRRPFPGSVHEDVPLVPLGARLVEEEGPVVLPPEVGEATELDGLVPDPLLLRLRGPGEEPRVDGEGVHVGVGAAEAHDGAG